MMLPAAHQQGMLAGDQPASLADVRSGYLDSYDRPGRVHLCRVRVPLAELAGRQILKPVIRPGSVDRRRRPRTGHLNGAEFFPRAGNPEVPAYWGLPIVELRGQ